MNDITGVVLVLFLEMVQDSDLFLGLAVEPLLISHLNIGLYSTLYIGLYSTLYIGLYSTLYIGLYSTLDIGLYITLYKGLYSTLYIGLYSTLDIGLYSTLDIGLYSTLYIACVLWLYAGNIRVFFLRFCNCVYFLIIFLKLKYLLSTKLPDPIHETRFPILGFQYDTLPKFRGLCLQLKELKFLCYVNETIQSEFSSGFV